MKKIVLINPLLSKKYPQPPLGLLSLGTVLKNKGMDVRLVDMNVGSDSPLPEADVYGIGIVSAAYEQSKQLVNKIRDANHGRIIAGGAHPSALPELVKNDSGVDALVIGEGEEAIFEAINSNGIIQMRCIDNLDNLPIPDYGLLDWKVYHPHPPHGKYAPFIPLVTSRGCPFQCLFCAKSVFGNKYRAFSAQRTIEEVEYLYKKYGIREVAFYDDVFTLNKKRIYEMCDLIHKKNLKLHWSCETRVDLVDKELLHAMKVAGCFCISYGVESGNKKILEYLNKGIDYWQVYRAFKDTQDLGIETVAYFMFVPSMETEVSIQETIDLAKRLNVDFVQFSKMVGLPGSQVYSPDEKITSYATFGGETKDAIDLAQKRAYKEFYLSMDYILKRCLKSLKSTGDFRMTLKGLKMLYGG